MDLFQVVVLAVIQGLSEFLPISSSAHLILPSQLLGWPDQGLAFDVAVHLGSLAAVIFYFRCDLMALSRAWLSSLPNATTVIAATQGDDQKLNQQARLAWLVIVATLPTLVAGLLAKDFIEANFRNTATIVTTTLLFGLLLAVAELKARRQQRELALTLGIALAVGFAQILALIPGTSRSGVTITVAILFGLSRTGAARFSFLLSVPIIMAAGTLLSIELLIERPAFNWLQMLIAVVVSALSAWACIALFLKLIERIGLMPFVVYRLLLGGVLVALLSV